MRSVPVPLFLTMVNDLRCEAPLYKYVDDCAVTEAITKCHLESSKLQREIDYVNNWSIYNNLKINVFKKLKSLTYRLMSHFYFQLWL